MVSAQVKVGWGVLYVEVVAKVIEVSMSDPIKSQWGNSHVINGQKRRSLEGGWDVIRECWWLVGEAGLGPSASVWVFKECSYSSACLWEEPLCSNSSVLSFSALLLGPRLDLLLSQAHFPHLDIELDLISPGPLSHLNLILPRLLGATEWHKGGLGPAVCEDFIRILLVLVTFLNAHFFFFFLEDL